MPSNSFEFQPNFLRTVLEEVVKVVSLEGSVEYSVWLLHLWSWVEFLRRGQEVHVVFLRVDLIPRWQARPHEHWVVLEWIEQYQDCHPGDFEAIRLTVSWKTILVHWIPPIEHPNPVLVPFLTDLMDICPFSLVSSASEPYSSSSMNYLSSPTRNGFAIKPTYFFA